MSHPNITQIYHEFFRVCGPVSAIALLSLFPMIVITLVTRRIPTIVLLGLLMIGLAGPTWKHPEMRIPGLLTMGATLGLIGIVIPVAMVSFWRIPDHLDRSPLERRLVAPEEDRQCRAWAKELEDLGFSLAGDLYSHQAVEGKVLRHFLDRSGTIVARLIRHRLTLTGLTFTSEQDGQWVTTSNWPSVQGWPVAPGNRMFYHQMCRNAVELLRMHRDHLATLSFDNPRVFDTSMVLEVLQMKYAEIITDGVTQGYLARASGGNCRLTLKGGFRLAVVANIYPLRRRNVQMGS